jgi:hypothetical protein
MLAAQSQQAIMPHDVVINNFSDSERNTKWNFQLATEMVISTT